MMTRIISFQDFQSEFGLVGIQLDVRNGDYLILEKCEIGRIILTSEILLLFHPIS
jgi:hypothetical protein